VAKNTIQVTYKVNKDGSLKAIAKDAEKAAKSTKKATSSADNYQKVQKGVGQAGLSSGKAFSKMTTGITSGLVPAYATLAANVFALTALFGALSKAASLRLLEQSLVRVGNTAGQNLKYVSQGLRDITSNAISAEASMRSVALATSAGFSTAQLENLTKVAKGASAALGRDMTDAMDRLVRGTAKLEPEILDELGIMVRLDDATETYATTLGKTAKELTQYERRMAFLNATNEQGLQKFGALADSVEVNPYDKLAATFANLQKTVVSFLNIAVEPFVEFFSRNQWALFGVVAMFASTLIKTITPAIADTAKAARTMASSTQKQVTRLAARTENSFKTAAKNISSFKFAPKGLTTFEASLRKGVVSSAGLKDAIKKLQVAEKSRQLNIKKHHNANINYHLKDIAQKNLELKKIQQLKAELIGLNKIKAQGATQGVGGALGKAKGISSGSRKTAAAFKMMEESGPLKGLQIAAASTGKQAQDIGKATGALNKLSIGLNVAGNSAKLFGTAFLRLIPFVGQVILAWQILSPLISRFLPKQDALIEKTKQITASFSSFDSIGRQLADSLSDTSNAAERFIMTLRAKTGIIEQVISGYQALRKAQAVQANEDIKNAMTAQIAAERRLVLTKALRDAANELGTREGQAKALADQVTAQKALTDAQAEYAAQKAKLNVVDVASARMLIDGAMDRIKGSEELKASMKDELAGLEALRKSLTSTEGELGGVVMSADELEESLKGLLGANKDVLTSVDGARAAYSDYRKELNKLGSTGSHAFDSTLSAFQSLTNEMLSSTKEGTEGLEAFMQQVPELQKTLTKFQTARPIVGPERAADAAKRMITFLDKQKKIMITQAKTQAGIKIDIRDISKFTKNNAAAVTALIAQEELLLDSKEKALIAEQTSFKTLELEKDKKDRLLVIEQELLNIDKQRNQQDQNRLRASIEEIGHQQQMLGLFTKIQSANKSISEDTMKRAEMQMKIAALESGKPLKARDEKALFEAQKQEKIKLINLELNSKLMSIELEYKLLEAQTKLQKARARDAGVDTKVYDDLLKLIPEVQSQAASAAVSAAKTQRGALDLTGAEKTRAVQTAVSSAATSSSVGDMGGADSTYQRMKNVEEQGGIDSLTNSRERLAAMKGMIDPMIESLSALSPEGALSASIVSGAFAIGDAFELMKENIGENTEGLGAAAAKAEFAGQAISAIGGMMAASSAAKVAGIDAEIAAEQKRDGKSAASIAKIKAMEKKKEQVKKKAFETDKKIKMATVMISTASAVMKAVEASPLTGGMPFSGMAIAMGALQLAAIAGTSYQGGGSIGSAPAAPTSISVGQRGSSIDMAKSKSSGGELSYLRGDSGMGGPENFRPTPAFSGYKNRAAGGFVVGEQGPEVFMPEVAGDIIPAGQNMGSNTNVNFSINAVDADGVEDLLVRQRGNIIGMMREAANSYGQDFMEGIDTSVYTPSSAGARRY
jgi:hypothetical protein